MAAPVKEVAVFNLSLCAQTVFALEKDTAPLFRLTVCPEYVVRLQ